MKGILIHGGHDGVIESRGKGAGLAVVCAQTIELRFEKTAIVEAGTRLPWDLLPAAWHFLDKWDAAVPLWRYGVLAADIGGAPEREATRAAVHDLRVLVHAVELLFVRRNQAGCALVQAWQNECSDGGDKRLAFLRALCQVKPRLCVLPVTWLAEVRGASVQAVSGRTAPERSGGQLVRLELEPGRFVKVRAGDENRAREQFERQRSGR